MRNESLARFIDKKKLSLQEASQLKELSYDRQTWTAFAGAVLRGSL